ncbi:MAG: protein kinase [Kofleriaceae bacterium]
MERDGGPTADAPGGGAALAFAPTLDARAAPSEGAPERDRAVVDDGELRAFSPALDPLQMELSRAQAEQRLFGVAEPPRLGRYVLLGRLAAGGMGVVYGAYDPQLDRRVALKLVHSEAVHEPGMQQRLIAEGRALARLDHPNVVPVHDVVVIDGHVVVVMMWVEGETLASWEQARARSWREVVAAYLAAGRGLEAAHALGLVHRDFKPSNAIISEDGRVRILDFGLARLAADEARGERGLEGDAAEVDEGVSSEAAFGPADTSGGAPSGGAMAPAVGPADTSGGAPSGGAMAPADASGGAPSGGAPRASTKDAASRPSSTLDARAGGSRAAPRPSAAAYGLTRSGEVLGTLGFIAPELFEGDPASAASDQFAFCVSLYRALFGARPFRGETVEELIVSMRDGVAEPKDGHGVPGWLRAALRRGLATRAEDRFPSMTALLDELSRERGWRRARLPLAVTGAAAVALVAAYALREDATPLASCDTGAAEIAPSWDPDARGAVVEALARAGAARAEGVSAALLGGLDRYRGQWAAQHRAACLAHRDGAQSALVLDQRMTCLRRRRDALAAAVSALRQVEESSLLRAREVVARLPPISDCADLDLLAAEVPPPPTAEERARVESLEARLASATALEHLGRASDALALLAPLVREADELAYPPLAADGYLAQGRVLLFQGDVAGAQAPLARAEELSFAHELRARAVVAAARRLYAEAMDGGDLAGLLRQGELLEKLSRPMRDGFARPLLLNNLGVLHMARKEPELARAAFLDAKRAIGGRAQDLELTAIDRNLAMGEADPVERARLARGVWEARRAQLGELHLFTLEAQASYGMYLVDPAPSRAVMREACERYRTFHPGARRVIEDCTAYQAFLTFELDELSEARRGYLQVAELSAARGDAATELRHQVALGNAALCAGDAREARRAFERALRTAATAESADWGHKYTAQAELGVGLAWPAFAQPTQALPHLERAVELHGKLAALNSSPEHQRRLALARGTLAALLRRTGGDVARAVELQAQAEAFYRSAGADSYRHRLAQLER